MKLDLSQPKHAWTVVTGLVLFLGVLPNLDKGWAIARWVLDAFPAAYAGKQVASEVRSDFDRYLAAQAEALKLEQQRQALQADYNRQLMELQQRQAPASPILREWDEEGNCWECPVADVDVCWDEGLWKPCR